MLTEKMAKALNRHGDPFEVVAAEPVLHGRFETAEDAIRRDR